MSANISILGNVGRAPETHTNADGKTVAKFSIASNSVQNTPQGTVKKTDWFRVTAVGRSAETLAKYVKRGTRLHVQGALSLSAWRDREDQPQYSADLLLQDFQFAGGGNAEEGKTEKGASNQPASGAAAEYSVETEIAASDVQEIAQPAGAY